MSVLIDRSVALRLRVKRLEEEETRMNHVYKTVWNNSTKTWVAVSELSNNRNKANSSECSVSLSCTTYNRYFPKHLLALSIIFSFGITISSDVLAADAVCVTPGIGATIGSVAAAGDQVACGQDAIANSVGATAVGINTRANAQNDLALGAFARAIGAAGGTSAATAVGAYSFAQGAQSIAMGARARAEQSQSIAVGNDTRSIGIGGVSIGGDDSSAYNSTTYAIAGYNPNVGGRWRPTFSGANGATAIAPHAQALTQGSTAIGVGATAGNGTMGARQGEEAGIDIFAWNPSATIEATAIGAMASASGNRTTAVGYQANATGSNSTAIGSEVKVSGNRSIVIGGRSVTGLSALVSHDEAIAIGAGAQAILDKSVALGSESKTTRTLGIQGYIPNITTTNSHLNPSISTWTSTHAALAIGDDTQVNGQAAVTRQITGVAAGELDTDAVNVAQLRASVQKYTSINSTGAGNRANDGAKGSDSIAIGLNATTNQSASGAIALGHNAQALAVNALSIGMDNVVNGDNSAAIGFNNKITTTEAGIFGNNNQSSGQASRIIGNLNIVSGTEAVVLGNDNVVSGKNTIVVGDDVVDATLDNSVVLGVASSGASAYVQTSNTMINGVNYNNFAGSGALDSGQILSIGKKDLERQIKHVAAGQISATSTDAVNGSQLYSVAQQATKPLTISGNVNVDTDANLLDQQYIAGDGTQRQLGDVLKLIGAKSQVATSEDVSGIATSGDYTSKNIQTVVTNGQVQIQMADNPEFTSLKIGDVTNNTLLKSTVNGLDAGG